MLYFSERIPVKGRKLKIHTGDKKERRQEANQDPVRHLKLKEEKPSGGVASDPKTEHSKMSIEVTGLGLSSVISEDFSTNH
jgi:hypothetical protein